MAKKSSDNPETKVGVKFFDRCRAENDTESEPIIRIGGKILEEFGFTIGQEIKIQMWQGLIVISAPDSVLFNGIKSEEQ